MLHPTSELSTYVFSGSWEFIENQVEKFKSHEDIGQSHTDAMKKTAIAVNDAVPSYIPEAGGPLSSDTVEPSNKASDSNGSTIQYTPALELLRSLKMISVSVPNGFKKK